VSGHVKTQLIAHDKEVMFSFSPMLSAPAGENRALSVLTLLQAM
jgi:hypothetical protein